MRALKDPARTATNSLANGHSLPQLPAQLADGFGQLDHPNTRIHRD